MGIPTFPLVSRGALVALQQWTPKCAPSVTKPGGRQRTREILHMYIGTIISALTFGPHRLHPSHTPRATHTGEENTSFSQATIVFSLTKRPPASAGFISFGGRYIERKGQQQRCFKQSPRGDRGSWPFLPKSKAWRGAGEGERYHDGSHMAMCCLHSLGGLGGRSVGARGGGSDEEKRGGTTRGVREVCRLSPQDNRKGHLAYIHRRISRRWLGTCPHTKQRMGFIAVLANDIQADAQLYPQDICCLSRKYIHTCLQSRATCPLSPRGRAQSEM